MTSLRLAHINAALTGAEWGETPTSVIDPTHDETDFIRRLTTRRGEISLQGNIKLLKINRLIPKYVTHVRASVDTGVFTLTHQGWKLARLIGRKHPLSGGAPF